MPSAVTFSQAQRARVLNAGNTPINVDIQVQLPRKWGDAMVVGTDVAGWAMADAQCQVQLQVSDDGTNFQAVGPVYTLTANDPLLISEEVAGQIMRFGFVRGSVDANLTYVLNIR
jgi:hypothetical protein